MAEQKDNRTTILIDRIALDDMIDRLFGKIEKRELPIEEIKKAEKLFNKLTEISYK